MVKFADAKIHKKQPIDLWLVHEQKSVQIVRQVQETNSAAYCTYQGCIIALRGRTGSWYGNF